MHTKQPLKRQHHHLEAEDEVNAKKQFSLAKMPETHTNIENDRGNGKHIITDFWETLLAELQTPVESDLIRECEDVDVKRIVEHSEEYFALADKKLHVFPFEDVRPCWHRLYTDTSIVKAIQQILESLRVGTNTLEWLIGPVHILDMALIMAGGFGREDMLANIHEEIASLVFQTNAPENTSKEPKVTKKLPTAEHSIPKLKYPVLNTLCNPTLTLFENWMYDRKEPVLLTDILENWPALEKWQSLDYWRKLTFDGRRLVPVEVGRSYVDADWGQQIIPFEEFLDKYIVNEQDQKGYLAQYDLFHHIPELNKDVATPDYCFLDAPPPDPDNPVTKAKMKGGLKESKPVDDEVLKNVWFGPPWTISPLHHDPYHNILCQVVGKKYVRLYSPEDSAQLYPRSAKEAAPHGEATIDMSNTSHIDVASLEISPDEDWDETWPGISALPHQEVVLEAGQALYIPVGWWHYVRSCSVGISVSFWWS